MCFRCHPLRRNLQRVCIVPTSSSRRGLRNNIRATRAGWGGGGKGSNVKRFQCKTPLGSWHCLLQCFFPSKHIHKQQYFPFFPFANFTPSDSRWGSWKDNPGIERLRACYWFPDCTSLTSHLGERITPIEHLLAGRKLHSQHLLVEYLQWEKWELHVITCVRKWAEGVCDTIGGLTCWKACSSLGAVLALT